MKTKLLKKLRRKGRSQINIYSVTTEGGSVVGIKYGYDDDAYSGIFDFGLTEEEVLRKAERIYIEKYISEKRATKTFITRT